MAIKITGYKYIQHKLKTRPWGCECQFTFVSDADGRTFDDVISISSLKISEADLMSLMEDRLKLLSAPRETETVVESVPSKEAVVKYLVDNAIIKPEQTLELVKTKMASIVAGGK